MKLKTIWFDRTSILFYFVRSFYRKLWNRSEILTHKPNLIIQLEGTHQVILETCKKIIQSMAPRKANTIHTTLADCNNKMEMVFINIMSLEQRIE